MLSSLSVVFAVVYLLFFQVGNVLVGFMGPMGYEVIFGIWFIVSIIAATILRKPGAAVIEVLIGNAVGPILIVSALIQGLGAEAAFAATRYRSYSRKTLMLAGVGAALFSFAWGYFRSGFGAYSAGLVIAMLAVRCVSGAFIAGLLGHGIAHSLKRTGVLRSYPIAKEGARAA